MVSLEEEKDITAAGLLQPGLFDLVHFLHVVFNMFSSSQGDRDLRGSQEEMFPVFKC